MKNRPTKMKKLAWISAAVVLLLLAVLLVPIPTANYDDGGTREYTALTYRLVKWNRITPDGVYKNTRVYFGSDRGRSIGELWQTELSKAGKSFLATVIEFGGGSILVEPLEWEEERRSSDRIIFSFADPLTADIEPGSTVKVSYIGGIMESYPARINAIDCTAHYDPRSIDFSGEWLDKKTSEKCGNDFFADITITAIYSNCFFAETVDPSPYKIKLNGELPEQWCVGDRVTCTYKNTYYDSSTQRVEADLLTVTEIADDLFICYKPVIYLYPAQEVEVSVSLTLNGRLSCTYPAYDNGWKVTAAPDGTLTDAKGQTYNYLYWEGKTYADYDLTRGFCVKGEDTAAFLEDALAKLGLDRREANEFIVYWLPLMQDNPYNIISFQTDRYTDSAKLNISPAPDTLIRVFMAWRASNEYTALEEQKLTSPERNGFTVVEWGGTKVD